MRLFFWTNCLAPNTFWLHKNCQSSILRYLTIYLMFQTSFTGTRQCFHSIKKSLVTVRWIPGNIFQAKAFGIWRILLLGSNVTSSRLLFFLPQNKRGTIILFKSLLSFIFSKQGVWPKNNCCVYRKYFAAETFGEVTTWNIFFLTKFILSKHCMILVKDLKKENLIFCKFKSPGKAHRRWFLLLSRHILLTVTNNTLWHTHRCQPRDRSYFYFCKVNV